MEGAELELERRSKFLSSLIQQKKAKEHQEHHSKLNVHVRAADMPVLLQDRAFRCAREQLDSMPGKLDSKRLALALKKEFDAAYGPAWHCIVGTSFGSYVTHSTGGFLYFSIDKKKREHEITGYFMKSQQILPAFVSHLGSNREVKPGPPHDALFFVLAYLDVFELLVMSEVCMPLRDAVSKDVLPWRNIVIERPLNSRLSDEILVQITTRAHGRLRTLALVNCFKITDDGLQTVIEKNHLIRKLHIPGCSGLTPEGIIRTVKTLSRHHNSLESLQINGISSLKKEHLETISSHLQMNPPQQKPQLTLYRHHRNSFTSRNKESSQRMIDVDICPKCNEVRIVFDCPRATSESGREQPFTHCRGCCFCISRCEECGRCVDDEEVEETLCSGILCTDCWLHLPKCCSCNKAYCKQHANQLCSSPDTTGFLCDLCNEKHESYGKLEQ